jgi:acetyl esterase/lipase
MTAYRPFQKLPGDALPAALILPGGGYGQLSAHEGEGYARWLTSLGIPCFVLQYRLGDHGYRHPTMLEDATRALRLIRKNAPSWGIDPARILVVGSSAGGHLAATLSVRFDSGNTDGTDPVERVSSRPDLAVLCYPVITMGENTHDGSRQRLLGESPTATQIEALSAEKNVRADTPPTFMWHTVDDPAVSVANVLLYAEALRKVRVPFELHIYQQGGHGLGIAHGHPWMEACLQWLRLRQFLPPPVCSQ